MGNVQALLQAQHNGTKLEVKGVAESRKEENRFATAATNWTNEHTANHSARGRARFRGKDHIQIFHRLRSARAANAKGTLLSVLSHLIKVD